MFGCIEKLRGEMKRFCWLKETLCRREKKRWQTQEDFNVELINHVLEPEGFTVAKYCVSLNNIHYIFG